VFIFSDPVLESFKNRGGHVETTQPSRSPPNWQQTLLRA